ncbi:hypothetical protein VCHENC02_1507A, partial [Vibrio harveyi]
MTDFLCNKTNKLRSQSVTSLPLI